MRYLTFTILFLVSTEAFSQSKLIEVNNEKIRVRTIGIEDRKPGEPVIVFESGHGTPMGNWDRVISDSLSLGPIVTYDRPGVGESQAIEETPTIKNVADRLLQILDHFELEPPYVLVGHSLGGVYVRGFAVHYPEKLAGLVIVDPGDFTETQVNKREYYRVLGWDDKRIDQELAEQEQKWKSRNTKISPALQRERVYLRDLRKKDFEVIQSNPLPNIPVHILAGGRFDTPKHLQSNEYDSEALFRSKMRHRVARWTDVVQSVDQGMIFYSGDAGHFVQWDDPKLVVASIQLVLKDYAETAKKSKTKD